jgi:hypothetical protein
MRSLQQSTAYALMVFMTDSADHIAGKTGLTLTITASKAGAAFASISPSVTERGNGWYNLDLTTAHTDTLGDLAIRCTAAGADPTDLVCQVQVTAAALVSDLTAIKAKTDALPADPADQSLLAAAIDGVPVNVRSELAAELARVDVAVSTRNATAPDNAGITAIKAKTDALTISGGNVAADIKAVNGYAVTGTGATGNEWGPA